MKDLVKLDTKANLLIAAVFMVLGFMISVQYKTTEKAKSIRMDRVEDLSARLKAVEKEKEQLGKELAELRKKSSESLSGAEIDRLSILAGATEVEGPGLEIVLDDSTINAKKDSQNPNLYILHDEDLLRVVNELRASGAEAMSLNEQRIISTTEIRCAGPTVSVNNVRSAPPYVIKVIGDPKTLTKALQLRGGVIESFQFWGIQVKIKENQKLKVPALKIPHSFTHTKVVRKGEGK